MELSPPIIKTRSQKKTQISTASITVTSPPLATPLWRLDDSPRSATERENQFSESQINQIKALLKDQNEELLTHFETQNIALKTELSLLKDELKEKNKLIVEMEKDIIDVQQYVRRNNIEICGIPDWSVGRREFIRKIRNMDRSEAKKFYRKIHKMQIKNLREDM